MCSDSIDPLTEIGGYFGLDLADYGDPFPNTFKFQSGRAALRQVLECIGTKQVYLPVYVCDAVVQAVVDSGAIVESYTLDDSLSPKDLPTPLPKECVVLYVNYFGLCDENVAQLLHEIPKKQIIIDNSQALFSPLGDATAAIYSIRKYIGVPDGGLLAHAELDIKMPQNEDTGSMARMTPMLLRAAYSARTGYSDYVNAEKTLVNTKPLRMSRLTKRLMASVDMDSVRQKRRENFCVLAAQLDEFNEFKWQIRPGSVPLCYPLLVSGNIDHVKERLASKGIFIPNYWPEIKSKGAVNSIEYRLSNCCLFLPCDQRYSPSQINMLAREVIRAFESS